MNICWSIRGIKLNKQDLELKTIINVEKEKKKNWYKNINAKIRGEKKEEETNSSLQKQNHLSTIV